MLTLRNLALAVALSLAATAPAAAVQGVGVPAQHLQLTTTLTQQYGVGEYDGTMDLTISSDGIVNGYYRPNGERIVTVTGGVDSSNGNIWLDFGFKGRLHVSGTLQNGTIAGATLIKGNVYEFKAQPATP